MLRISSIHVPVLCLCITWYDLTDAFVTSDTSCLFQQVQGKKCFSKAPKNMKSGYRVTCENMLQQ